MNEKKKAMKTAAEKRPPGKKGISAAKTVSIKDASNYLEEVAMCLKKGKLVVTQGDECCALALPDAKTLKLKIDVKQKKDKTKVEIGMTWQHLTESIEKNDLKISITEPVKMPPPAKPAVAAASAKKSPARKSAARAGKKAPAPKK